MHKLLRRQLFRNFGDRPSPELDGLIEMIDQAYNQFEADNSMLQRSLELTSNEMLEINRSLRCDIELRIQAEEENQRLLSLLKSTLNATADGILVVDKFEKIVLYNRKFLEIWDTSEEQISSNARDLIPAFVPKLDELEAPDGFINSMRRIAASAGDTESCDTVHFRNGRVLERRSWPRNANGGKDRGESGANGDYGRVWSFRDISDIWHAQEQLKFDSLHDALTGLANRTLLEERLNHVLRRAQRDPDVFYAVLFVDLDRFKNVNDGLGHAAGDAVLIEIAHRLEQSVRLVDTVARTGGDEFIILLEDLQSPGDATCVAARVRKAIAEPLILGEQEIYLTASIGIARRDHCRQTADEMIRDADTAMYTAKRDGRDRWMEFDSSMHTQVLSFLTLESALRKSLPDFNGFSLVYQPIVNTQDLSLAGFEALLRWETPERGPVPPSEFIPIAEEAGLIQQIGWWVMKEACEQLRRWRRMNLPGFYVAVNVSLLQFRDPQFYRHLIEMIEEFNVDPATLRIELTESSFMESPEDLVFQLNQLHLAGFRFSVDDFGTGYSSLSHLARLRLDTIKIDRSFVYNLPENKESTALTRAIVSMASGLEMATTAEGVETEEQYRFLREAGCQQMQGYWISRPLTAHAALDFAMGLVVTRRRDQAN